MTTRRGFLGALLAAAAAPAIVRASSIMPVRSIILPPPVAIWKPKPYIADKTIKVVGSGLRVGDCFTIAGVMAGNIAHQRFVVSEMVSNTVLAVRAV